MSKKKDVGKLLEGNNNSAQQAFKLASEAESRYDFVERTIAELGGEISQLRCNRVDNGVYERILFEFKDGSVIQHTTWIDEKQRTHSVSLRTIRN